MANDRPEAAGETEAPPSLLALIGAFDGPADLAERHELHPGADGPPLRRSGVIATVLDTGPIVASLNAGDRRHAGCARLITTLAGRRLLPSPVLTEVCWLLERRREVLRAVHGLGLSPHRNVSMGSAKHVRRHR